MEKRLLKPGNMVYPVPVALVSCVDGKGNKNLITVAWTGTICSDPAMLYISIRPERYSYNMIKETGEFVLNLTTSEILKAVDFCGVKSGKDIDKWKETGLTQVKADRVKASLVKESPVNIECKVKEIKHLGTHDMFIAEVLVVHADNKYFDKNDSFHLDKADLIAYSHGGYMSLGKEVGTFGFSVKKNSKKECLISKKCGGCKYSHLEYAKQLSIKQNYIEKLLSDFGKVNAIIGMDNPYYYRNKVHHVFDYDKKKGIISGSYVERTHRVLDIDNCLIEDRESQEIIKTIKKLCVSFKYKTYDEDTGFGFLRHVLIRKAFSTGDIMLVLVCADRVLPGKNNFVKAIREKHPNIKTIVLNMNDKKTSMVLGDYEKILYGDGFIEDQLLSCKFRISLKSFYQINPIQTEVLYNKAIEYADIKDEDTIIDTYCGIGTIGICAAKKHRINLIGVESNADAVKDAKINVKVNDIKNARFVNADATDWIEEYDGACDVLFMDPPRSGSTDRFIKAVGRLRPKKIIYISCGPESLERDLRVFEKIKYKVKTIQPVDLFPLTEHIETIVKLEI